MKDQSIFKRKKPAKVPVIIQMEALECGAACLSMVMAYYGRWISLEELRQDCGVSRDGSKASNIIRAARKHGMEAKGIRCQIDYLKKNGSFPCIIFWNFNHFVVLNGFYKNKAYLNDPARGRLAVSMEEFDRCFTGVCLTFQVTDRFLMGGRPKSIIVFAKERLAGSKKAMIFTLMTALITTLIGVISPGFTRVFMDRLLSVKQPSWTRSFFVLYAAFLFVQICVSFISTNMGNQINAKLNAVGNANYLWKVLNLPMRFFSQRSAGDIYQRQSLNAEISGTLVNILSPFILQVMMLVFYLVVMLRYSIPLTCLGISTIVFNVLVAGMITKKKINSSRVQMRDSAKLEATTVTGLEMIETIKSSGAENGFFRRWAGYQASINRHDNEMKQFETYLGMIPTGMNQLSNILIQTFGIWLIIDGQFTIGILTAFQGYLQSFMNPAQSLIDAAQGLQQIRVQMERLDDVMKYPMDTRVQNTDVPEEGYKKLSGNLEIKNLSFGYSNLEEPLIKNFNLKLDQGKSIAIVGKSGCGKSTLAKLISGLYQPWEGEILFDGIPIEKINHRIFTGSLAVVDQDISIFEDTIENNIKMWDESIEDFEMILAARDAQIHQDIMVRPDGYQHMLREGGKDFSGGQRQRIEIARVLAQDPTIIILDEATSALDAKTEADVVKAITDRGVTCIVIAHRLSTIRDCDEIIVMNYGEIVEQGTHRDLYVKGGIYTELVTGD